MGRSWASIALLAAGCQALSGVNDLEVAEPSDASALGGSAGSDASAGSAGKGGGTGGTDAGGAGAGGSAGLGGGGDAGAAGSTCKRQTETFTATADTEICDGQSPCDGTIVHGAGPVINIGVCVGLLTFSLTTTALTAVQSNSSTTLTLSLARIDSHAECLGPCPASAGTMVARPLRSDWVEWNGTTGADWCRRTATQSWGAPGALSEDPSDRDVWPVSAAAPFLEGFAQQPSIDLSLLLEPHRAGLQSNMLSVRLEESADGYFVATTREGGSPARLAVSWCP